MFCVDREPCFTLLNKLGDVQTYRETYKTEKTMNSDAGCRGVY